MKIKISQNCTQTLLDNGFWLHEEKQKFWNKAYQNYMNESGLSAKEVLNFININPFVALRIENQAIEFLNKSKEITSEI